MKQHGVLFTTENRLSIRADHKTMTRRIPDSFKEINEHPDEWEFEKLTCMGSIAIFCSKKDGHHVFVTVPWVAGDELYIKEPLGIDDEDMFYKDDKRSIPQETIDANSEWIANHWDDSKTSISPLFMPKWAARDWLRIMDVKVERLQSIDELDALNEGTPERFFDLIQGDMKTSAGIVKGPFLTGGAVDAYRKQWDEINGKSHPWKRNEWLVAYTFERIKILERV